MSGPASEPSPKSPLLLRQVEQAFGGAVPAIPGLERLLALVDGTYKRLAGLQQAGAAFGRTIACELDLAGSRLEGGRHWKMLLGYHLEELDDSLATWRSLIHEDDAAALFRDIAAARAAPGAAFSQECRFRDARGEWRWLQVAGRVTRHDAAGAPLRVVAAITDVDRYRRSEAALVDAKEAAERAGRARSAFLASMSHEIRTPMNAVLGMTELALGTRLDPEQRHYLAIVKSSAEALLTIINDILDFSKIDAGKLEFEHVDFSPRMLVFEAVRAMALRAQEKGLEVLVTVAADVPSRLRGDPTRLRQVVTNLVSNAIKFTERGEVVLELGIAALAGDTAELHCCVRDTGIGIPADKQRAVFDAFAQADATITRRFGGTGLGLAICSRLVELMGGRIWLESEPGQGSRFHFTGRFGIEAAAAPGGTRPADFAGRRALVVMTNDAAARQTAAALDSRGFAVVTAASGEMAAAALAGPAATAGLLLADGPLLLADDGALVRSWQATVGKQPVIALHTLADQQSASAHLRALGVDYHLVKPIAPEDLDEAVDLALGRSAPVELERFTVDETLAAAGSPSAALDILLVEDNPINQELAVRLLEKLGHRVTVANHGEEALQLFDRQRFAVILMDVQMPVMGGIEATEAIRAREMRRSWIFSDAGTQEAYIVAMTANAMAGDREHCLQAGMNDYVSKPIRLADLTDALARACAHLGRGGLAAGATAGAGIDMAAAERDIGDRELVVDLARTLLEQWQRHVAQIDAAYAAREARALLLGAHTIKGFLAMFHAESGRQKAQELEQAAKREDWTAAAPALAALKAELDQIKPLLAAAVQ